MWASALPTCVAIACQHYHGLVVTMFAANSCSKADAVVCCVAATHATHPVEVVTCSKPSLLCCHIVSTSLGARNMLYSLLCGA